MRKTVACTTWSTAGPRMLPSALIRFLPSACPTPCCRRSERGSSSKRFGEHLLTPYGLRSLAPSDPQYRGRYTGGPVERDGAYHQGTVWPWLIGPFITAYVKVNGASDAARRQAGEWLEPLQDHLSDAGSGTSRKFSMATRRIVPRDALRRHGALRRSCGPMSKT